MTPAKIKGFHDFKIGLNVRFISFLFFLTLLLGAHPSFAGTNTGCSGDQWSDHEKSGPQEGHYVYRTNDLWQIGTPGDNDSGCGVVSKRSKSTRSISMENRICRFRFTARSRRVIITPVERKHCSCEGSFDLKMTCKEGEY
jgi:hypothetical protein